MDNLIETLNDSSRLNVIYTIILVATTNTSLTFFSPIIEFILNQIMDINTTIAFLMSDPEEQDGRTPVNSDSLAATATSIMTTEPNQRASLLVRIARRLALYSSNLVSYLQNQFNEHTATSIASCSALIILLSIICCFIMSLMREEERKIKEQYKKLNTGSSHSFIGPMGGRSNSHSSQASTGTYSTTTGNCCNFNQFHSGGYQKIDGANPASSHQHQQIIAANHLSLNGMPFVSPSAVLPATSPSPIQAGRKRMNKLRIIELRRETYFGLVRLLKPGCRTIVLLCDLQSKAKLLSKYYNCVYPYRKNKTLQFTFLVIEKNIGWYKDLLKLALNEKRQLNINPINCIGTVLILNGFKKYFSVYHASDSRWNPDEPFLLLEETLLDNLPEWLERLFAGKVNRYYVESWPDRMR